MNVIYHHYFRNSLGITMYVPVSHRCSFIPVPHMKAGPLRSKRPETVMCVAAPCPHGQQLLLPGAPSGSARGLMSSRDRPLLNQYWPPKYEFKAVVSQFHLSDGLFWSLLFYLRDSCLLSLLVLSVVFDSRTQLALAFIIEK